MGDADCTYDFRELKRLSTNSARLRVHHGLAVPRLHRARLHAALHRYLGTPVTTAVLNFLYATRFTDIHCGMRGITRDALVRINLLAILGVRLGNGAQIGPDASCGPPKFRCVS